MKKIIVNTTSREKRFAVIENNKLVKLEVVPPSQQSLVGNIYFGKVTKVLPGMDAVFIDFGEEKNGFLHRDHLPSFQLSNHAEAGPIGKYVRQGEKLLVQVTRDETAGKGAKLTGLIELSTECLVYIHGIDYVGISKKFKDPHSQQKWREAAFQHKRVDEGLIIRTSMEDQGLEIFEKHLTQLRETYEDLRRRSTALKSPALIHSQDSFIERVQNEIGQEQIGEVIIDDFAAYKKLEEWLSLQHTPWRAVYYKGKENIFSEENIQHQLDKLFKKIVWLENGGYLIIDQTEALTVIDVNTGKYTGKTEKEQTMLQTNLQAAKAAANQIRLRNIAGIILIDFINTKDSQHKKAIINVLKEEAKQDEKRTTVVGFTELGILQLTRKRTSQSLSEKLLKTCPCCNGTGRIDSPETIAFRLERELMEHRNRDEEAVWIETSPITAEVLLGEGEAYRPTLEAAIGMKIFVSNTDGLHHSYTIKRFGSSEEISMALRSS
ncbi:ribonuclease E/G [Bacillus sp. V5-8f]|uniref:Rne/Rng family ribonuclease n=1 Tax=Bacillus sp. V5-8f TaxID=2053044 RepID=UPI0015E104EF|nr:ribonuclease E/G [Bacillus sp. V5-8f]